MKIAQDVEGGGGELSRFGQRRKGWVLKEKAEDGTKFSEQVLRPD